MYLPPRKRQVDGSSDTHHTGREERKVLEGAAAQEADDHRVVHSAMHQRPRQRNAHWLCRPVRDRGREHHPHFHKVPHIFGRHISRTDPVEVGPVLDVLRAAALQPAHTHVARNTQKLDGVAERPRVLVVVRIGAVHPRDEDFQRPLVPTLVADIHLQRSSADLASLASADLASAYFLGSNERAQPASDELRLGRGDRRVHVPRNFGATGARKPQHHIARPVRISFLGLLEQRAHVRTVHRLALVSLGRLVHTSDIAASDIAGTDGLRNKQRHRNGNSRAKKSSEEKRRKKRRRCLHGLHVLFSWFLLDLVRSRPRVSLTHPGPRDRN